MIGVLLGRRYRAWEKVKNAGKILCLNRIRNRIRNLMVDMACNTGLGLDLGQKPSNRLDGLWWVS